MLAYKPTQKVDEKISEQAKKSQITFYSSSVSRNATTQGTATTTITDDYIATYANFAGYVEAFDNNPKTRTYDLLLNGVFIMRCSVANASPTASYQDKANETLYLPNIKVRKGSTLSIVCTGNAGNVNSGTYILGGYLE